MHVYYHLCNLCFWTGKTETTGFKMRAKSEQVRAMEWALIKNKIVNETVKARALLKKLERDMPSNIVTMWIMGWIIHVRS